MFVSRRCYAVYDLRRQAPATTTTRIPDPRTYLPPAGCPTSFFYPPRLPQERKEKKIRYNLSAFFVTPALPASSGVPDSRKRPSLLSLACASGRLSFAVRERYYCVYFLSAITFHVRTYADASFHITIQARSTNTRFTYVQSSTLFRSLNLAFVY